VLRVADDGGVRVLTLDRPEVLNAFDTELYTACADAFGEAAARDDVACVVLTGAGRAFSSGQDLAEMRAIDPGAGGAAAHGFARFIDTVAAFDKPLLAAVNGLGVGIGMTVLLHCDLVLMADTARLRAPFVPLGVVPEAAGSLLMPAVMGTGPASHALYTGAWLSATDALACGLAWRVVPAAALFAETMAVAREIASMPVAALVETKRAVLAARLDAVRAARAREDAAFARMVGAAANEEALAAFLDRRER
jgi:enoyl-CoA hydratase/carnithine racemase